jgi:hypothetical protein
MSAKVTISLLMARTFHLLGGSPSQATLPQQSHHEAVGVPANKDLMTKLSN